MKLAALCIVTVAFVTVGCGEDKCSNDHDEFYRYYSEGIDIDDLLTLKVGRSELSQSCNEIGYHTAVGGFQAADVYHIEPTIELQNHKLTGYTLDFLVWRMRAMHGGVLDEHQWELFVDEERVVTESTEMFIDSEDLGRNVRIEASVHMLDPNGEIVWAHATGAAHIDTSR